jgi:hypothetical protein
MPGVWLIDHNMPLPVPGEVHGLAALQRQRRNAVHLIAIRHSAVIFPPRTFLRVAEQMRAGSVIVKF